jgi:hypothetical protein
MNTAKTTVQRSVEKPGNVCRRRCRFECSWEKWKIGDPVNKEPTHR